MLYASGRQGVASWELEKPGKDIIPVFEALLKHIPAPHGNVEKSLQIQISNIQYNDYVGRIGVGRIYNGKIRTGQQVTIVSRDGTKTKSKVQQVQVFEGLGRKNIDEAFAGDICTWSAWKRSTSATASATPPIRSRWRPPRSSRRPSP